MSQLPAGWLSAKIGGKYIIGVCMFVCSVVTLVMPVAARAHPGLFIGLRVITGLCQVNDPFISKRVILKILQRCQMFVNYNFILTHVIFGCSNQRIINMILKKFNICANASLTEKFLPCTISTSFFYSIHFFLFCI